MLEKGVWAEVKVGDQHLRQLARNAKDERLHHKPLHAYRDLFRALREVLEPGIGSGEAESDEV